MLMITKPFNLNKDDLLYGMFLGFLSAFFLSTEPITSKYTSNEFDADMNYFLQGLFKF